MTLHISSFIKSHILSAPQGASHSGAAELPARGGMKHQSHHHNCQHQQIENFRKNYRYSKKVEKTLQERTRLLQPAQKITL